METKELKITIPEGYEIDKENSTFEKIVFKKKENAKPRSWNRKPRSWKEYLELNTGFDGAGIDWNCGGVQTIGLHHRGKAIVPTHLAQPFIAMMQLMSLRQAWIGDWKPDLSCVYSNNYCVVGVGDRFYVCNLGKSRCALSFPTEEMATDFMNCFKDLLEIAKPLI